MRADGMFRLQFSLSIIGANNTTAQLSAIHSEIFTDVFTVFQAKRFPGMIESTELSKCLARQGVRIPVRKDPLKDSEWTNDD